MKPLTDSEKNKIKELADSRLDASWDWYFNSKHKHHAGIKKRFSWAISKIKGPKLIDIGCGPGLGCYLAAREKRIQEVHGIDASQKAIKYAMRHIKSKKVTFHCGFAEELNFSDGYFDSVLMTEVLEHVCKETVALKEAYRVLKVGGILICSVPNGGKISKRHLRIFDKLTFYGLISTYFKVVEMSILKHWIICEAIKIS